MITASYFCGGITCLALGLLGAFLPGLPTTIFLIAAVFFFERSWPAGGRWLTSHPRFGPQIVAWRERGEISLHGKIAAACGMLLGTILTLLSSLTIWPKILITAGIALSLVFVLSRPDTSQPVTEQHR